MSLFVVIHRKKSEGYKNYIEDDGAIEPGHGITSKNRKHRLEFGQNGSLKIVSLGKSTEKFLYRPGKSTEKFLYRPGKKKKLKDPIMKFVDGRLSIHEGEGTKEIWSNKIKAGGAGCKLTMEDDGTLTVRNSEVIWSSNKKEGFEFNVSGAAGFPGDYDTNIKMKRDELNTNAEKLKSLPDQSNLKKDASTLQFILWATLASSLAFFLLFGS